MKGTMKGKIGGIYQALQGLELKPTPENAKIMTAVFNTLEDIYNELEEAENGRSESSSESRAG